MNPLCEGRRTGATPRDTVVWRCYGSKQGRSDGLFVGSDRCESWDGGSGERADVKQKEKTAKKSFLQFEVSEERASSRRDSWSETHVDSVGLFSPRPVPSRARPRPPLSSFRPLPSSKLGPNLPTSRVRPFVKPHFHVQCHWASRRRRRLYLLTRHLLVSDDTASQTRNPCPLTDLTEV